MRIKNRKKGFTIPEIVVTLIIFAIILAIGIPTAIYYINRAEFRKNDENAKTIYMAAESVLTWYRSSGQWEEFRGEVLAKGMENTSLTGEEHGRIYAVTLDTGAYNTQEGKKSPVLDLMDDLTYSKDLLSAGSVAIEIDVDSGHVYSAFYGTRCKGLGYATGNADQILDMNDREYDSRRKRFLGYYSTEDVTNVVDLDPVKLKISSINLVNSETLYLNWSSNSRHDNLDLEFQIVFREKYSDKELFRLTVDRSKLKDKGWSGTATDTASIIQLPMLVEGAVVEGWSFPLTYQDGSFSLVLDGMMSADALAHLEKSDLTEADKKKLHQTSDMSITRLAQIDAIKAVTEIDLTEPQNIYATVQAFSTYNNMSGDTSEYKQSSVVDSNTANTLYADDTKKDGDTLKAGIAAFRHLSNIRYCEEAQQAEFTLKNREMDWNSSSTGVYDSYEESSGESGTALKLKWTPNDGKLQFPSVPELAKGHSLTGGTDNRTICNLRLGTDSVPDDTTTSVLGIAKTEYVGLFGEAAGSISHITFKNPSVVMADVSQDSVKEVSGFNELCGVGIIAGKSTGDLTNLTIQTDSSDKKILTVSLAEREDSAKTAGVGGIAGVIKGESGAKLSKLSVSGKVSAKLPKPAPAKPEEGMQPETAANDYSYGVGGIFGYANLENETQIKQCENHADVSGNLFAGGIAGKIEGSFKATQYDENTNDASKFEELSNLMDCKNDGLILCTVSHKEDENQIEGRYFGGIVGYAHEALVYEMESASGRSSGFTYSSEKEDLLKGQYVGGILGFGSDCLLLECKTENKGYILGSDYVGGIVGGLMHDTNTFSRIGGGVSITTNAGYVIGNSYVGGIIGKNDGNNKIQNCINNGVAAGYTAYIGGIVGYNGEKAIISNCVSFISDHSGKVFNQIVDTWKATGSYAGGIAGYNNGEIEFKNEDTDKITVKSVSGIVVGQDYVGGVVGFNDTSGKMDLNYVLIGGRIYAYGDCAGGYIGLNASTQVLNDEIEIRPSSVRGTYCVGGCIGANVVDLTTDTEMAGYRTNNVLGKLTAKAFAGGVIGYQRTYTAEQLGLTTDSQGTPQTEASLLSYLQQDENNKANLVPQLDKDNLPTKVEASKNEYEMTLTDKENPEGTSDNSLNASINNLAIQAQMYVGGVLGYCENDSELLVKNCKNSGRIAKLTGDEFESSADGVSIVSYLRYSNCPEEEVEKVDDTLSADMAGGIVGANLTNQVIDHCANSGNLSGFTCLGGVVGFNGGGIFNCELTGNFGNANQDYVGGIAGLNVKTAGTNVTADQTSEYNYKDINGKEWNNYIPGTIAKCSVTAGVTVTGRNGVGGITAYNLPGGVIQESKCLGNVTSYENYAGGIIGRNAGILLAEEDESINLHTISGRSGQGIGGLVGRNETSGSIQVSGTEEVVAISTGTTVVGGQNVGGLVGENCGEVGIAGAETENTTTLVCQATSVRALKGNAGGIAGISTANIVNAKNVSGQVTADTGLAGGIVASVLQGAKITSCANEGNVNSDDGNAGGIAAENDGKIEDCTVSNGNAAGDKAVTIRSRKASQTGAICAVNHSGAIIESSAPKGKVELDSDGKRYGAVVGLNQGTVTGTTLTAMPEINANGKTALSVGGTAGVNENTISEIKVTNDFAIKDFSNYRYLGGVAGENTGNADDSDVAAVISGCTYAGTMTERSGSAGNCYGGIAGINFGTVTDCSAGQFTMEIQGYNAATSTNTAEEKETLVSHVGGIVGKNEESGKINRSYLSATTGNITVANGMAGGVAGYNKGMIQNSGDKTIVEHMAGIGEADINVERLCTDYLQGVSIHNDYIEWQNEKDIEDLQYNKSNTAVSKDKTKLIMSTKGSLGGITAYNSPTGELEFCATGDWFLNNKSEDIAVGTGGIIGMNESEKDMSYLVNRAFVGRQLKSDATNPPEESSEIRIIPLLRDGHCLTV